jgi:3-oxoacyl-[acyl-carrier-protein] synthase II
MTSRTEPELVISGLGVITPIGSTIPTFWAANLAGRSGVVAEERMDLADLPCGWVAGLIPTADRLAVRDRWARPGRSWGDCLLHEVVDQALADAELTGPLPGPAGLVWARVWPGPSGSEPADYVAHLDQLATRVADVGTSPGATARHLAGRPASLEALDLSTFPGDIAERLGTSLVATRLEATCAGGLRAIAEAARLLRLGEVECVVVAASVSRNTPFVLSQYAQLMALSKWRGEPGQASMPFDERRSGMVINESAGALVLETAEHAARRGVRSVHAVVSGWGLAVGTGHMTAPDVQDVERVMKTAIERSGLRPDDIDAVNAHGTSTRLNDLTEARALHQVFGPRAAILPVSAVKSLTGHGSAASGLVETAVAALTMTCGVVPPVVTCTQPDPRCDVATSLTPRVQPIRTVLKNSFGFGGQYASMVFQRPSNPRPVAEAQPTVV